ncbi:MAG: DUF5103 domain-containing protein [Paludibacteraceae bacterium]|nr:DUF5103 domain-containing protein [Paludibacteraceae bacterium]
MNRCLLVLMLLLYAVRSWSTPMQTAVLAADVQTLRLSYADSERMVERPFLMLGGTEQVMISFDQMSHDVRNYSYRLVHCNADWTPSDLQQHEYQQGMPLNDITDYQTSLATTQPYTHYWLKLPNEDVDFRVSGNYVVQIFEDNDPELVVAQVCLCVVMPQVEIRMDARANTDIELSGRYQQLDIDIMLNGLMPHDVTTEMQLVVEQNGRLDNRVSLRQPNYITPRLLQYKNNRQLIFEGGNEYRRFDIASTYLYGVGVEHIEYDGAAYHAYLEPCLLNTGRSYQTDYDVDGRYVINAERVHYDVDTEADYIWVHWFVPTKTPWLDSRLYIGGDLCFNTLSAENMMQYKAKEGGYVFTKLLKQGGYNYQLWLQQKGRKAATTQRTEGSYWQTENEYTAYLYYRPQGERYDQLIGIQRLRTNL